MLVTLFVTGCGVESESSADIKEESSINSTNTDTGSTDNTDSTGTGDDQTDTGVDTNTTETPATDTNTTDGTTTNPGTDANTTVVSIFDTVDATLDAKACGATGYVAIVDSSFDPEGYVQEQHGIEISSSYPMGFNPALTEVKLFHPGLEHEKLGVTSNVFGVQYYFSYDHAWVNNSNTTIYIRTPLDSNGKYGCYRYEITSTVGSDITATKVYR